MNERTNERACEWCLWAPHHHTYNFHTYTHLTFVSMYFSCTRFVSIHFIYLFIHSYFLSLFHKETPMYSVVCQQTFLHFMFFNFQLKFVEVHELKITLTLTCTQQNQNINTHDDSISTYLPIEMNASSNIAQNTAQTLQKKWTNNNQSEKKIAFTYLNRWIRTQCSITKIRDDCCKSFPSSKYRSVYTYEHRSVNGCLDIRRDFCLNGFTYWIRICFDVCLYLGLNYTVAAAAVTVAATATTTSTTTNAVAAAAAVFVSDFSLFFSVFHVFQLQFCVLFLSLLSFDAMSRCFDYLFIWVLYALVLLLFAILYTKMQNG